MTVGLKPHPDLTADQKRVIAQDFGMKGERLDMRVRLALLYYVLKRLNLDFEEEKRLAREQHVVLANSDEVRQALSRALSDPTAVKPAGQISIQAAGGG